MKASELASAELDFWVAKAEGLEPILTDSGLSVKWPFNPGQTCWVFYNPSTNWEIGGKIIEFAHISILFKAGLSDAVSQWEAQVGENPGTGMRRGMGSGPTPLIAAMRAFVQSKFGDEVI